MRYHDTIRQAVLDTANRRGYLPRRIGYSEYADLDGKEARRFLEACGFEVVENRNDGRNGVAVTREGIQLSTNGYCCIVG